MSENISARKWLIKNGYSDVAELIDQIMRGWQAKGTKTRRNWWWVLAGGKGGRSRTIEGVTLPVLKVAQIRMGISVTDNALCRNANECAPKKVNNGRWKK